MGDLAGVRGDIEGAIERVRVPAYVIDQHGIIRWINAAAEKIVGDVRGKQATSVLAAEEKRRGREIFARNLFGPPQGSDNRVVVIAADGTRVSVEVSAVPLKDGDQVIGVFGQAKEFDLDQPAPPPHPHLTPRQSEVLHLLEQGRSTKQIADELHLSLDTVRNHIRRLLRALGVHSRLEAVAAARHDDLVLN